MGHNRQYAGTFSCLYKLVVCVFFLSKITSLVSATPSLPSNAVSNRSSVSDLHYNVTEHMELFHWEDYSVLATMLIVSCAIGVFYAYFGEKQTTSDDFLLGGSSMGTFPMALSLAASFITAIELLGNPAEMYIAGAQFWMICVAFVLVVPITSQLYLPVFMRLRLTSCYEYLEVRFCKSIRVFASALYMLQMVLYTAVAVYAPALALSDVTGLNTYLAVTLVYVVCIFYASQVSIKLAQWRCCAWAKRLFAHDIAHEKGPHEMYWGGMKAVIMTDTFQSAVLLGSLAAVLALGGARAGGLGAVWRHAARTDRLHFFDMDPDPTVRHSFWSVVVGGTMYWTSMFCANQASVQKYLSVERIAQARVALWVSALGLFAVYSINFVTGAVLAAHYADCDPIQARVISASDRLLPLYVVSQLGDAHGVPGFFVAGIFAASLGTVASTLNSLAAIACQDLATGLLGLRLPEEKGAVIARWVCLGCGVVSFALTFAVERLGPVLQLALSFNGMVGGVTLGLFTLGMLFPWANAKGAVAGGVFGLLVVMAACGGAQLAHAPLRRLPGSVDGCPAAYNLTATFSVPANHEEESVFWLFRVSYLWYSGLGCTATLLAGLAASAAAGFSDPALVPIDLISPPVVALLNALPSKVKSVLRVPARLGPQHSRRGSSVRPPSVADDRDTRRRRRLSEMAGGVFYSEAGLGQHDNLALKDTHKLDTQSQ